MSNANNVDQVLYRCDLGHYEHTNINISFCDNKYPALWSIASRTDSSSKCSICMISKNNGYSFAIGDQSTATFDNLVVVNNNAYGDSRSGCKLKVTNSIFCENECAYVFKTDSSSSITVLNCKYQVASMSTTSGPNIELSNSIEIGSPAFAEFKCVLKSINYCAFPSNKHVALLSMNLVEGKFIF